MNPRRRVSLLVFAAVLLASCLAAFPTAAEPQTLPLDKRPEWVARDGIVMAGSWEPLSFRVRRDGKPGYTPTPEQLAAWRREHSPEMVAKLKALGVNFVMMHCYKGAGLEMERESMAEAVRFSKLCHECGLRVGVYNFSGALLWEPFLKERPQAKDWAVRAADGNPVTYGDARYRFYWNRNHPEAEQFYRGLVRFAVEEIGADLLHFDNYNVGPGHDPVSVTRFRRYLGETFTPKQLAAMGADDPDKVQPPAAGSPDLLRRAWQDFVCRSLAESYWAMGRYARSLRSDVLVECNPGGVGGTIYPPVDHGRLLQGGEAYWVESGRIGYRDGRLVSRIRNYKVGRAMGNMTFDYTLTPLEMAESMAFNLDCLGCIFWFEYAKIVSMPGVQEPMSPSLERYVRFFHQRRDLLRGARVVADAAVLRSFPSMVFGGPKCSALTARVEDLLIENRACFQILHEHQLAGLRSRQEASAVGRLSQAVQDGLGNPSYHGSAADISLSAFKDCRVLVLAGCPALGDAEIEQIRRHMASGGRICVIGPLATHDRWMTPRAKPALDDLPSSAVFRAVDPAGCLDALRRACDGRLSLEVSGTALEGLCSELTEQPGRRLVHLVNYRADGPARALTVGVRLPPGKQAKGVRLASPDRDADRGIPHTEQSGIVRFTVPEVGTYEIAVVEY